MRIEKSDVIEAPIDRVYAIVADVLNYPSFLPGLRVEMKSAGLILRAFREQILSAERPGL